MKKALPIKIREANIISLKEAFISKDYKTSQEVIKGCKAALGMLFESFEILDSSVSLKESYWSPNHLCRDLADRARVIKVSFELEIDLSNIDYYLKFFSRKDFSEKIIIFNTENLARKPNPNELCWIINSNNFFDINDNIHIDLTHNKDNETYFVTFSIPLKEYPGLEDRIAKYIELLNNKKNLERKIFLLKDSFIKNDLKAALISNIKCCQLNNRIDRLTKLIEKLLKERSKAKKEKDDLTKSLIQEFTSSEIEIIKSKIDPEENSEFHSLEIEIFN